MSISGSPGPTTPPRVNTLRGSLRFDTGALAGRICDALERPGDFAHLREGARRTAVDRYAVAELVPRRARLLEAVADGLMDG